MHNINGLGHQKDLSRGPAGLALEKVGLATKALVYRRFSGIRSRTLDMWYARNHDSYYLGNRVWAFEDRVLIP